MEYGEFKVKDGVYVPDIGIDYPKDDPHQRIVHVEVEDTSQGRFTFDETYPYLDDSLHFKLNTIAGWVTKWILVATHNRCHFGLQIKGNLRKYKEQLKDGAVCICNHVFLFDALGVNAACKKFRQVRIPMFPKHFNGHGWWILWQAGGVPIPETREGIRKYKEQLKDGAVCICNHVFLFDALGVNAACKKFRQVRIPMFPKHFNGHGWWILWQAGGVPIPETREGIRKYNEAFDEYARRKMWFIIFPEAVRWDMYTPIRPFKRGAFSMAYKYNRPIIPFVYTFRKRRGIYRLFGKKDYPCVTLHVGEPIWFDKSANRKDELDRVCREAHEAMQRMAGIEVNPWPYADEA